MPNSLRRKHVSATTEKRILTAMIVSTQFNQEIIPNLNLDYFTNSFIKKVARWCVDFYLAYNVAPFNHIQDIFNEKQTELTEEDADLIQKILLDISKKYELNQGLNVEYSIDQALRFFKMRELQIIHGNMGILLEKNDIDGAEDQINSFNKISRVVSGWVDPFEDKYIDEVFTHTHRMFNFPGELGKFLGGLERGWLVGIAAPFKKGKTWNVQEIGVTAIQQRLKVASFSLEMGTIESNDRFYKRMLGAGTTEGGPAVYPCFDCVHNQDGSCSKTERTNTIPLLTGNGKPIFTPALRYRPCTACRYENPQDYSVAWWYELINRPAYDVYKVRQHINALKKVMPNRYRFKQYPKFSANIDDIRRDLDILERTEGFVPDVILVDQANGLKPESGIGAGSVEQLDSTWKALTQLAGERFALVVSPSQVTRAALDKKNVKQGDIAQWIGMLGHIDCGFALNQTPEEKREGVMRYSIMIHRHDDFNEEAVCIVLQNMKFGQIYLDAHITTSSDN